MKNHSWAQNTSASHYWNVRTERAHFHLISMSYEDENNNKATPRARNQSSWPPGHESELRAGVYNKKKSTRLREKINFRLHFPFIIYLWPPSARAAAPLEDVWDLNWTIDHDGMRCSSDPTGGFGYKKNPINMLSGVRRGNSLEDKLFLLNVCLLLIVVLFTFIFVAFSRWLG